MPHSLEIDSQGVAKFAYSDRQTAWHRLGIAMKGLQTPQVMLASAQADYDVVLTKVVVCDDNGEQIRNPDGTPIFVPNSRATVRQNADGSFQGLATVGTRFVIQQNREVLDYAMDIVGASKGQAIVDTCGVLHEGKEFFASLDLGTLVIDPTGVNDKIEKYLLVRNGHDGKTPITFANTSVRAVCKNTVIAGLRASERVFTARHTRNVENAIERAQEVLEFTTEWSKQFTVIAEKMLATPIPKSSVKLMKLLDVVFPEETQTTDRQQKNRENVLSLVRAIYDNENNAKGYGYNAWSAFNAVGEYLDHYRDANPYERAIASMDTNSWVSRAKLKAQDYLLSVH